MKILTARFKNLIGVMRASGKSEIFIDFKKCTHKITLIVGENGSGKTTILEALTPIPDSASMYIDHVEGSKEIEYLDNGIVYRIRIIYPINTSRERAQTKAFLSQVSYDGECIELNPNGNIGSYKNILYDIFNLDPNFISLSKLSLEDKGLVHKTPSERKKYVSALLETTEVYNNIYKALTKRSSVFKSMINSITSKIDIIGNKEQLETNLNSISKRLELLMGEKEKLLKSLSDNEATIRVTDPDGFIQNRYNKLVIELKSVKNDINHNKLLLSKCEYDNEEDTVLEYKNTSNDIIQYEKQIEVIKSELSNLLITREEEYKSYQLKQNRMMSITSELNFDDLKNTISTLKTNISNYENIFNDIGIENFNITKDEYVLGLNVLKELKERVDTLRSFISLPYLETAVNYISNDIDANNLFDINQIKLTNAYSDRNNIVQDLQYYKNLNDKLVILENRPSNCKISSCYFIKDALEAKDKNPKDNINRLELELNKLDDNINNLEEEKEKIQDIIQVIHNIKIIIRNINSSSSILAKLPNGYIFSNKDIFLDKLLKGSTFNEINDIYTNIRHANIFELYRNDKDSLIKLESEYKLLESKNAMIDELYKEIDELSNKINDIANNIDNKNLLISNYTNKLNELYIKKNTLNEYINIFSTLNELQLKEFEIESRLNNISNNIKSIEICINNINSINSSISNIQSEINPLNKQKDEIKYSLNKLNEYYEELNVYNQKYERIEIIRKYSSPSKGIQTVFMEMYMGKTLSIANELLSYVFDGRLTLLDYIINENEFRIPCKSNTSNIINDDITSCSSAEKSMIGMITNFALLKQSSTKYNILRLDEVDGALDQKNKSVFPVLMDLIMDILEVENCIMISHSSESDLNNTDIIYLGKDKYNIDGNIIFTY